MVSSIGARAEGRARRALALVALLGCAAGLAAETARAAGETRTVTLRWRAAPGPEPEGFVVLVGAHPGSYRRVVPLGLPEPDGDGVYAASVELAGPIDQHVSLLAFNSAGPSPPSNERAFPAIALPDPGETPIIGLGPSADGAALALVDLAGGLYRGPGSTAPFAGRHLAWCDLDGDGATDLLLGQDATGAGELVAVLGPGDASRHRLAVAGSALTRPACGDLDGDGRDEVVVGLGAGGGPLLWVFDDATTGFRYFSAPGLGVGGWLARPAWPDGAPGDGAATPAVGDLDGDGRDEIVVALDSGSGGRVFVLDDAVAGLRPLDAGPIRNGWLRTGILDAALWPAVGDFDADGRAELAFGFGGQGEGAWVRLVDDPVERPTLALGEGWLPVSPASDARGAAHPGFGDLDGDGAAELVVGFDEPGAVRVFTDLDDAPRPFGDDGWLDVSRHDLAGPLFPAVRGPTHEARRPAVLLGGGPVGAVLPGVRLDGSEAPLAAGGLASPLPGRLAWCDVTGTDTAGLLAGYGPGAGGRARLGFLEGGAVVELLELVAGPADYAAANGELRPACGDVDGDGRDELILGPGPGGHGTIFLRDDARQLFRPWPGPVPGQHVWTTWGSYLLFGGEARPAAGDLDGDGRDEIVIGLGPGGGGWLHVLDDASTGFAPLDSPGLTAGWLRWSTDAAYVAAGGSSWPALGDVDGDGLDEIAVGVDAGGGGHVALLDDARGGFRFLVGLQASADNGIQIEGVGDGSTRPTLLDVDGDGRDELVVGFGAGGTDRVYVADDALADFEPHPATPGGAGFLFLPPGLPAPVAPAAGAP